MSGAKLRASDAIANTVTPPTKTFLRPYTSAKAPDASMKLPKVSMKLLVIQFSWAAFALNSTPIVWVAIAAPVKLNGNASAAKQTAKRTMGPFR